MKRLRIDGGYVSQSQGSMDQRRARAIGAKMRAKFPYSDYSIAHVQRGSADSLGNFGPSFKEASAEQKANRRKYGMMGRGMYEGGVYTGHGKYGVRKFSRDVRALGGFMPKKIGRALTDRAVNFIGQGSYESVHTNQNVFGASTAFEVPRFASQEDGASIVISNREYVCDLYGPTTSFNNQSYQINPGLEASFPWLAQIAANYDEYEFKQLMYTYRSTTTDIGSSTSGQCGTIIMATNYNAAAEPFTDKQTMMEYDGSMSGKTTEHHIHGVECDPSKLSGTTGKYVRCNPVVVDQDLKTYDHGQLNIAIANSPTGFQLQAIGELWVSYTVHLRKPRFFTGKGLAISQDLFVQSAPTSIALWNQPAATFLKGQQNNIGANIANSDGTITFPAAYSGNVEITYRFEAPLASSGSVATLAETLGGNVAHVSDIYCAGDLNADSPWHSVMTPPLTLLSPVHSWTVHLRVKPATGGVNNTYKAVFTGTVGITCASVQITEYNSGFARKQDGTSDAPVLINSSGVVTVL